MRAALALLLLLLAGCGSAVSDARRLVRGLSAPSEPDRMAIAAAESDDDDETAATIRFQLGRRQAVATLMQQQGERRLWRAPGGVVIQTDGARVSGTAGLPQIITGARLDGADPLDDPRGLVGRSIEARRVLDLSAASRTPEGMRFGVPFTCRLRGFRTEEEHGVLVEESCRAPGMGRVENQFWADARTNRVLFAEQWVGPGLPALAIDFEPE